MDPSFCPKIKGRWMCMLRLGNYAAIPLLYSLYVSEVGPEQRPCECGSNGHNPNCNKFNFIVSLITYKIEDDADWINEMATPLTRYAYERCTLL